MRVLAQTQVVAPLSLHYKHTGNCLHFKLLRAKICWTVRILNFVAYFTLTNRITEFFLRVLFNVAVSC